MTSSDKDFRFMATNDLMTELQKDSIKLDDESERKVEYDLCSFIRENSEFTSSFIPNFDFIFVVWN